MRALILAFWGLVSCALTFGCKLSSCGDTDRNAGESNSDNNASCHPDVQHHLGPAQGPRKVEPQIYWGNLWGTLDAFRERQAEHAIGLIEQTLAQFPPKLEEPYVRRMALVLLDTVLHDPEARSRSAVQRFHKSRIEQVADELEQNRVSNGAVIWKLYNHGFIVRTPTVTFAFDIIRGHSTGVQGFAVKDAVFEQIVRQCDALFISHNHGDHTDSWVIEAFKKKGKHVVGPGLSSKMIKSFPVQGGKHELEVLVYPGCQSETPNNVTLIVSPENISFCHTGDQWNEEDYSWIDEVSRDRRIDVLMPASWIWDMARVARGIDPEIIIPGHENELGHIDLVHRIPYWMTYDQLSGSPCPIVPMTWGESYHYIPK